VSDSVREFVGHEPSLAESSPVPMETAGA
jgi:hypothetical protein